MTDNLLTAFIVGFVAGVILFVLAYQATGIGTALEAAGIAFLVFFFISAFLGWLASGTGEESLWDPPVENATSPQDANTERERGAR